MHKVFFSEVSKCSSMTITQKKQNKKKETNLKLGPSRCLAKQRMVVVLPTPGGPAKQIFMYNAHVYPQKLALQSTKKRTENLNI